MFYQLLGKVLLSWVPKLTVWGALALGLLLATTVATQPILIAKMLGRACASMPAILASTLQTMVETFFTELVGGGGIVCPDECYQRPFSHGAFPNHTPDPATPSPGQKWPNESAHYARPPTPAANPFWPYLAAMFTLILGKMGPATQAPVDPAQ